MFSLENGVIRHHCCALRALPELSENAVRVSSDEVILGKEKADQHATVATQIDADIDIELGKQVSRDLRPTCPEN